MFQHHDRRMNFAPVRLTGPATDAVDLDKVKAFLKVTGTDSDDLIEGFISAAISFLDGWSGTLGRCLITQQWRQDFAGWPSDRLLRLPFPDCSGATVVYLDAAGMSQALSPDLYAFVRLSGGDAVALKYNVPVLSTFALSLAAPVSVTFETGYGATSADIPPAITTAITIMVGKLYSLPGFNPNLSRETVDGVSTLEYKNADIGHAVMNEAVSALLAPFTRARI